MRDDYSKSGPGKVMRLADNALRIADPLLRRTRAKALERFEKNLSATMRADHRYEQKSYM